MPDAHLEADFPSPEYTTPQGTQEHGVDHGYEERDVNFRALFNWFGGLFAFTLISVVLLTITNELYNNQLNAQEAAEFKNQPLLLQHQAPPEPWVLPNPVSTRALDVAKHEVLMGPWDIYNEEREQEDKKLKEVQLQLEDGRPFIPRKIADQVIAENGAVTPRPNGGTSGAGANGAVANDPANEGLRNEMPSYSSGGLSVENDLR